MLKGIARRPAQRECVPIESQACCARPGADAFGGRGGIAQYNRDFLSALCRLWSRVVDNRPAAARTGAAIADTRCESTRCRRGREDSLLDRGALTDRGYSSSGYRFLWPSLYGSAGGYRRAH